MSDDFATMNLALQIDVVRPWLYFGMAILVPLLIRIVMVFIESKRRGLQNSFWQMFSGFGGETKSETGKIPADYCLALAIGMIEMLAFPMLFATDQMLAVGFWLGFKTMHRWSYAPGIDRGPYNRYLLSNALILVGSYASARWAFLA